MFVCTYFLLIDFYLWVYLYENSLLNFVRVGRLGNFELGKFWLRYWFWGIFVFSYDGAVRRIIFY